MKIFCFGNEFLKEDSLAKELADELRIDDIEFVKCNSPEDMLAESQEDYVILDVAEGIEEVLLIESLSQLQTHNMVSLHDFDLSYFLKLMRNMGQLKEIKIIAIPMKGDKEKIKAAITELVKEKIL